MKGQIALEYLLVFTVVLTAFAFVASKTMPQYKTSMQKFEEAYARKILEELRQLGSELIPLGEGSFFTMNIKTNQRWILSFDSSGVSAEIDGKTISVDAESIFCSDVVTIEKKAKLKIERGSDCVSVSIISQ